VGRTRGGRLLALVVAVLAVASVLGACSDDDSSDSSGSTSSAGGTGTDDSQPQGSGPSAQEAAMGAPYDVERFDETFVDTTRSTPEIAGTGVAASDDRTLVTSVRIPQADDGRFPLIVFSHGVAGHPDKFVRLLDTWAEAGYVVVAPAFPLSNDRVPGAPTVFDLQEQSGDVSFLIDEVLARSHVPGDPFEGVVDNERIGIGGLSLGAATTYTAAFGECCADERVDAVVGLSGLEVPGVAELRGLPTFFAHSVDDGTLPYDSAVRMFESATGPAYLLTVPEGGHAVPYEDNGHETGPVIDLTTVRFWDRYLRGDAEVPEQLVEPDQLGDTTLELGGDLPPETLP
jgi:dienelactone hydrolase